MRLANTSSPGNSDSPTGDEIAEFQSIGGSAGLAEGLGRIPAGFYAGVVLVLVAAGSISLSPLWQSMFRIWATDPLRSIGAVFPLLACVGVMAAWRRLDWSMNGTSWALPLVALSILLARTIFDFAVGYGWLRLVNFGTALFVYAIGAVLLFGGTRLLRASIAPLCLLLFINPVPHAFNSVVDLPLQGISASAARAFAHFIGLQPTGVQLRMMFAPDFGMFIAPGCNGIRGSITLSYLALIFGYARRLRPRTLAASTLAAFLLGYALNLLRLCVLVVYYRIGISFPSIQKFGVGIDYVIGCTLFLFAALGLGLLIRSLEPGAAAHIPGVKQRSGVAVFGFPGRVRRTGYVAAARAFCFLALTLAFIVPEIRSADWQPATLPDEQQVLHSFPAVVGPYRLTRTWAEHQSNGMIALAMAEYSQSAEQGNTSKSFTFGLSMASSNHLVANCKFAQGIRAQWSGAFDATARQALPIHFVTTFYDDGISRQYDAESTCSDSECAGHLAQARQKGFFFAAPEISDLTLAPRGKRISILLRREWLDSDSNPSADLRSQFEADARLFMAQVDLRSLVVQYGLQL